MNRHLSPLGTSAVASLLFASLLGLNAAGVAAETCPSTSGVDGIGYVPAPNEQSCWWDGWATPGAPAPVQHCVVMDLAANPFSGLVANIDLFAARYGLDRRIYPQGHFGVDAETILGVGSSWLSTQCCNGVFGPSAGKTCYPTLLELHDYAATHMNWQPVAATNPPVCGNAKVEAGETCLTCPADAGECAPVPVQCSLPKVCIDPPAACPTCPPPPTLVSVPQSALYACRAMLTWTVGAGQRKRIREACDWVAKVEAYVPKPVEPTSRTSQ